MNQAFLVLAASFLISAVLVAFALLRRRPLAEPVVAADPRLDHVIEAQGKIAGQFTQTLEAQSALQKTLSDRLDALNTRLGESLTESASKTAETLGGIQTRLSVIDEAQKNITQLSGEMISLKDILSNKQARGAYGQGQMEAIIRDALPVGAYEFQATLSNRSRPDCVIRLPGTTTAIVIDSKFPLECFEALKKAATEDEKRFSMARVRSDVLKHVKDISEKYLIPGEVQSPAIMFVPSESIYAELHDGFLDVIQKAHRAQVVIVSPNILMLAINTVQTVLKDARMREQASQIQKEVGALTKDVKLLGERVEKLQRHFNQADGDLKDILISAGKIASRGEKIEKVELSSGEARSAPVEIGARKAIAELR
ncbi:MAG TPA: DNA recombination protein RmuC, partial [Rhizomicrobium sp.]|nr:DNA recombination protein RmuC [Rhizomicrobium sp.]